MRIGRRQGLPSESRPALIGKAIVALLLEKAMIQECDAQQFPGFAQALGEEVIFLTRRSITRGMVMLCDVSNYAEFQQTDMSAPA